MSTKPTLKEKLAQRKLKEAKSVGDTAAATSEKQNSNNEKKTPQETHLKLTPEATPETQWSNSQALSQAELKRVLNGVPVVTMRLGDLKPAEYNPRVMTESQRDALRASLVQFSLVDKPTFNRRSGNLVGGHQRLDVLYAFGATADDEIQVNVGDWDDIEERALNITLNNEAMHGLFDPAALQPLLDMLETELPHIVFDELRLPELAAMLSNTPHGDNENTGNSGVEVPEFTPTAEDDQPRLDERTPIECPSCGHEFRM